MQSLKQEEKRNLSRKNGRELFDDKLSTINLYPLANGDTIRDTIRDL